MSASQQPSVAEEKKDGGHFGLILCVTVLVLIAIIGFFTIPLPGGPNRKHNILVGENGSYSSASTPPKRSSRPTRHFEPDYKPPIKVDKMTGILISSPSLALRRLMCEYDPESAARRKTPVTIAQLPFGVCTHIVYNAFVYLTPKEVFVSPEASKNIHESAGGLKALADFVNASPQLAREPGIIGGWFGKEQDYNNVEELLGFPAKNLVTVATTLNEELNRLKLHGLILLVQRTHPLEKLDVFLEILSKAITSSNKYIPRVLGVLLSLSLTSSMDVDKLANINVLLISAGHKTLEARLNKVSCLGSFNDTIWSPAHYAQNKENALFSVSIAPTLFYLQGKDYTGEKTIYGDEYPTGTLKYRKGFVDQYCKKKDSKYDATTGCRHGSEDNNVYTSLSPFGDVQAYKQLETPELAVFGGIYVADTLHDDIYGNCSRTELYPVLRMLRRSLKQTEQLLSSHSDGGSGNKSVDQTTVKSEGSSTGASSSSKLIGNSTDIDDKKNITKKQ